MSDSLFELRRSTGRTSVHAVVTGPEIHFPGIESLNDLVNTTDPDPMITDMANAVGGIRLVQKKANWQQQPFYQPSLEKSLARVGFHLNQ